MNKLMTVTKVLLKNGMRAGLKEGKKKISQLVLMIILAVCFLPLAIGVGSITSMVYDVAASLGQEGIILSLGMGVSAFIVFFFGIFYVLNTFYFSKDVENFLPLPLKPSHIIGGKFIITVIYEYIMEVLLLGPIIVAFGIKSGAGVLYYLYSLIIFLLLPVVPLVLAGLIIMVIMCFTSASVNKDKLRLVGAIVSMALAIGINIGFQRFASGSVNPDQMLEMLQKGKNSLVGITSAIFPTSYFASISLTNSNTFNGLLNLVIFLGITALGVLFFLFVADKLYFKGAIGMSETTAKRKNLSSAELEKSTVQGSAFKAIVLKDLRILIRTPVFFINCVLTNFLWPVFMLLPFIAQQEGASLQVLLEAAKHVDESLIFAIGVLFIAFTSSSNAVAASAISREGRNLYIAKYIPASYKLQILAKAFTGVLISSINLLILSLVLIFIFNVSLGMLLMLIVTSILCIFAVSFGGIMVDLVNPKLNWDTEQKAVKQNLNVMFSMLIGLVLGGLSLFIKLFFALELMPVFLILTGMYIIICFALYQLISYVGVKLFEKL